MDKAIAKIECDPVCGFSVQSHDENEVMDISMEHAKKVHSMSVTRDEARKMIKKI